MAASYPTNFPFTVDDEKQRPNNVYTQPYLYNPYDGEQTQERYDPAMDQTAEYVTGLNPEVDPYRTDNHSRHSHHHHHHHQHQHEHNAHTLPPLTIRRHTPGSNDPSLQKFPINLQPSVSDNVTSSANVRVTIKRNTISPEQTFIQPVLYPVAVYVNNPVQQYPDNQPVQPIQPKQEITKPPTPQKPSPPPPTPPVSPDRYETESFRLTPSRPKRTPLPTRRPVRTDSITLTPSRIEPQRPRPGRVVIEEYADYDEYYQAPSIYTVPQKTISYRTVPGMTSRELENDKMDDLKEPVYVQTPPVQTVTYRTS